MKKLAKVALCHICTMMRSIFGRVGKTDNGRGMYDLRPNQSEDEVTGEPQPDNTFANDNDQIDTSGQSEDEPKQETETQLDKTPRPPKKPQNRIGKRRKRTSKKPLGQPKTLPEEKPELICREVHNRWQISLAIPHRKTANVSQGQSQLSPNGDGEYLLENFTEGVRWEDNEAIELFDGTVPLIFKLSKNWRGDGRQVKQVSNGYYLVVAPHHWRRKSNPPIESTGCTDAEFLVHYFSTDNNSQLDGFFECDSFFSQKRFSLKGETVADDSNQGDLFVGESLELTDIDNWQNVSWVRVGQEGGGIWNENFKPTEKNLMDFLNNREGWFYVRIYDENVKLTHGMDFRYLADLKEILVNGKPHSPENFIAPTVNGHTKTTIQFVGNIQVESDDSHIAVSGNNTWDIAPIPNFDKTEWTLVGNKGKAKVHIHLPRIWWRLSNVVDGASEWRDTAFEMSRDEFRNNRNAEIIIRLPPSAKEICVGFSAFSQYEGARLYPVTLDDNGETKQARVQIREFCNHREISKPSLNGSNLRMQCGEAVFSVVCILPDAPPPKLEPDLLSSGESLPTVCVLSRAGLIRPITKNKRFSCAELDATGLTRTNAKHLKISVDLRRKTKYSENIEMLRTLQGGNHAD